MPIGLQEAPVSSQLEITVPEFGVLPQGTLEPEKKYQARLYRVNPENIKALAEILGFTANFDSTNVRKACFDAHQGEGSMVCEVNRNARPTEVSVRYASDRWTPLDSVVTEPKQPWLKTTYLSSLPDKVLAGVAEILKVSEQDASIFFIRINLKERTAGLLTEEQYLDRFPLGAFSTYSVPAEQKETSQPPQAAEPEPTPPSNSLNFSAVEAPPPRTERTNKVETSTNAPKYATYSQSEIDRMMKAQADIITASLQTKVSSQQKNFQDAVDEQEKAFKRISDKLLGHFEETRVRTESAIKDERESARKELDQFKTDLTRELEQFRAQMTKGLAPNVKLIDEKIKALQIALKTPAAAQQQAAQKDNRTFYVVLLVAVLTAVNTALFFLKH